MPIQIAANVARVREQIDAAAARAGRSASDVKLIAVSKTRTLGEIEMAYRAGIEHLGENRVEEAESKRPRLELPGVTWHMIGHLQSRKARRAMACFDIVHSVDSVRLAQRLNRLADERGTVLPVLLEVNVSEEASKYGLDVKDRSALEASVAEIVSLSHLRVEGLMTVAFISSDPEAVRPVFARLRGLRDAFRERFPEITWEHLSMGMTDDFEVAVEEGATMVRVGRAIFGPRE
jgi:pyridoxal phosphate enzyme (YggS family)